MLASAYIITAMAVFPLASLTAAQPIAIRIEGAVNEPGMHAPANGRLAEALVAAKPSKDAYQLGISYLRASVVTQQVRLRAGLQHGTEQLARDDSAAVRAAANSLGEWLQSHDPTGRVPLNGSARLIQARPQDNPEIETGDVAIIPRQPATINVVGAVKAPCALLHSAQRDARQYLRDCPKTQAADPEQIYVIQPDGKVQPLGIALWNSSDPQAVAPGGTIYVPVRESALKSIDRQFNADFAAFIATQPIVP